MNRFWIIVARIIIIGASASSLFCTPGISFCQKENNIWYFGYQAGLDFNFDPPKVLINGAMSAGEGCASIADEKTGAALFYTNGDTVWNARNRVMPNGVGLYGGIGGQAALIIPVPGDSMKYYLLTVADPYTPTNLGLNYSIIDMKLDGGRGDVTQKNVNLQRTSGERLVAIRNCNDIDYWVIAHSWSGDTFYVYSVTQAGIALKHTFEMGVPEDTGYRGAFGYLKASPDRTKLAMVADRFYPYLQLFTFSPDDGVMSNPLVIPISGSSYFGFYGVSFSPDGSKVYCANGSISQYDLSKWDTAAIRTSGTDLGYRNEQPDLTGRLMAIQLAPDGKLYVSPVGRHWIDVIEHPNALGTACGFVDSAIALGSGRCMWGLPNMIDSRSDNTGCHRPVASMADIDTSICESECVEFRDSSANNALQWNWKFEGGSPSSSSFRDPGTVCFGTSGKHIVRLIASNSGGSDTTVRYVTVKPPLDSTSILALTPTDLAGAPGDTVWMQILIQGSPSGKNLYEDLAFQIAFPSSLLRSLDTDLQVFHVDASERVTVHLHLNPTRDTTLAIPFMISSGLIDSSIVSIEDARWMRACAGYLSSGRSMFHLSDVSVRDGRRFVRDRKIVLTVYPNPSSGRISFDFAPNEEGRTILFVTDILGRKIETIHDGWVDLGRYNLSCDLSRFASGVYRYVLVTPSASVSGPVVVLR